MLKTASGGDDERNMVDLLDHKSLREMAAADQLIAALGEAFPPEGERRRAPRLSYQVRARLELVDEDGRPVESQTLHTRDLSGTATGFVSPRGVPGDARGVLHLPAPDGSGEVSKVACRVSRTRDLGNGWFEGAMEFDGPAPAFSQTQIARVGAAIALDD